MSNKVKIYKGDLVNAIYPCELSAYVKNGWTDVEPKEVKKEEVQPINDTKRGKKS